MSTKDKMETLAQLTPEQARWLSTASKNQREAWYIQQLRKMTISEACVYAKRLKRFAMTYGTRT